MIIIFWLNVRYGDLFAVIARQHYKGVKLESIGTEMTTCAGCCGQKAVALKVGDALGQTCTWTGIPERRKEERVVITPSRILTIMKFNK